MLVIHCIRTNSKNEAFQKLVRDLDADLKIRAGEEHSFYAQFNKIDTIKYAIIAYDNAIQVGCGAVKEYYHYTIARPELLIQPCKQQPASTTANTFIYCIK